MTFKIILVLYFLLIYSFELFAVHDSLNFILQPRTRQCFYEDFEKESLARLIEG